MDPHAARGPALSVVVALLAGCGGDDAPERAWKAEPVRTLRVPAADRTPPEVLVRIERAGGKVAADSDGQLSPVRARLPRTDLRGRVSALAVARDRDGGVARARVSMTETVRCRDASGRTRTRRRVRYVPPPAIERIKITPGTLVPSQRTRRVPLGGEQTCRPGETALSSHGEVWAEAVNAHGLEAVSSHMPFTHTR